MSGFTKEYLAELQALPLETKVAKSKLRIREWYHEYGGKVYVSYSGGKDSTVLLHLVRSLYPDVPAVFSDTGLEYPEIRQFAMNKENMDMVRPKMMFHEVIRKYGYPIASKEVAEAIYYARRNYTPNERTNERKRSELLGLRGRVEGQTTPDEFARLKGEYSGAGVTPSRFNKTKWLPLAEKAPFRISHYCCNVIKKSPLHKYSTKSERKPLLGTLAEESYLRKQAWIRHGCNAFDSKSPTSQPMSFWTEQDVLEYIDRNHLPICSVYGDLIWTDKNGQITLPESPGAKRATTGCDRTGCVFCGFGMHRDKGESRFQRLKRTHPRLYEYAIDGGQWIDNPDYVEGLSTEPDEMGWIPWNPERIWVPDKKGLGMGFVFDEGNRIMGKEMWRY